MQFQRLQAPGGYFTLLTSFLSLLPHLAPPLPPNPTPFPQITQIPYTFPYSLKTKYKKYTNQTSQSSQPPQTLIFQHHLRISPPSLLITSLSHKWLYFNVYTLSSHYHLKPLQFQRHKHYHQIPYFLYLLHTLEFQSFKHIAYITHFPYFYILYRIHPHYPALIYLSPLNPLKYQHHSTFSIVFLKTPTTALNPWYEHTSTYKSLPTPSNMHKHPCE